MDFLQAAVKNDYKSNTGNSRMISIVIGTYNRKDQIRRCVESILTETRVPFHIYITDGGSNDGTIEYLESIASETVNPIFLGKLVGQAKAYNDAFERVTTPYVCWLSDDNVVISHGLDNAVRVLEQCPRLGMIALKTRDVQGPFVAAPYIGGLSSIGILNVNQGVLRTRVLRQVGGFSETFRNYGIDPDLTAKVLFSGYDVAYTRAVALHHYRNWSSNTNSPEFRELMEKQARMVRLYELKYARWGNGAIPVDRLKRVLIKMSKRYFQAPKIMLAKNRDWYNVLHGRFINVLDSIRCLGRDYHLVQRCPTRFLPDALPQDPENLKGNPFAEAL